MNKVLFALLGLPLGLYAGFYIGAAGLHALIGTSSHMDSSGFLGALIGAPVGAVLGGLGGVYLGAILDCWVHSRFHPLALVGAATGAVVTTYIAGTAWGVSTGSVPHVTWTWIGAVAGFGVVAILLQAWHAWNRWKARRGAPAPSGSDEA